MRVHDVESTVTASIIWFRPLWPRVLGLVCTESQVPGCFWPWIFVTNFCSINTKLRGESNFKFLKIIIFFIICSFHHTLLEWPNWGRWDIRAWGRWQMHKNIYSESLKWTYHFGDTGIDGIVILKLILKKYWPITSNDR
jgi:hypothetical protein